MSWILSYVAFALCYVILGLVFSLPADLVLNRYLHFGLELASFVVAAPIAILLVQRSGSISASGLLLAGAVTTALLYIVIWSIYQWWSVQVDSSVPIWRVAQVGGWPFTVSLVVQILAPVIWRILLPRPNNSFKPTPLRGAT